LATDAIVICEGENAVMNFTLDGYAPDPWGVPSDYDFIVNINGEPYELLQSSTSIDFGVLEVGETVFNILYIGTNSGCHIGYEEGDFTFTVKVNAAPTITMGNVPEYVCEGSAVNIDLGFTGTAPFTVEATGIDGFTADANNYTLTILPEGDVNALLTKVTDANGCETMLEQAINVIVNPFVEVPVIRGNINLDARITPTSPYSVSNHVKVSFSIEPEEAGTLEPAEDNKNVVVHWSDTYKGEAVLIATPISECNNGNGTLTINVKNSTDVSEYNINASLYPNPTNGNVTIEAEGMQRLTVINELGQVVYDAEVNSNTKTLNMSPFGVGVFMIRIYSENGMGVKRVSVIR